MSMGEINKGAIALILALLVGAAGYLWYSQLYTPAVTKKTAAATTEKTAQDGLAAAKTKLASAQKAIEDSKKANSAPDDSVARVQLARKAVPPAKLIDDAAIVLMDLARRADVRTSFSSGGDEAEGIIAETGSLSGATPVDLRFEAAGTYDEMMLFMRLVEDTVVEKDGKLYARDRLFNVVKLEIGGDEEESQSSTSGFASDGLQKEVDANELVARPGEILFTVTVRMYTSSTDNAQGVGAATSDPAAQPTDGSATGAPADGSAPPTDGSTPGAADGTAPPTDGSAQAPADGSATPPDGSAPATDTGAPQ